MDSLKNRLFIVERISELEDRSGSYSGIADREKELEITNRN